MTGAPKAGSAPASAARHQHWDPNRYQENAGFVAKLGEPLIELLAPQPGWRILDLGAGDGALTVKLTALGCDVLAVDSSPEQIEAARARGLAAEVVDGHDLRFGPEFDAVFSNAALHWMKRDPDAVVAGVFRALKQGGLFVAEFGGAGNVERIRRALTQALSARGIDAGAVDPWFFPAPEDYTARLEDAGFLVEEMSLFSRPTPLPGDISGWLQTFCESFLTSVGEEDRPALIEEVRRRLEPELLDAEGHWQADYVRLRFRARKP